MKLHVGVLLFFSMSCFSATTITNTVSVNAIIPADPISSYEIKVTLDRPANFLNLIWDETLQSFKNVVVGYTIQTSAPSSALSKMQYNVGVRSMFFECSTQKSVMTYRGIDMNGVNGFYPIQHRQTGHSIEINTDTIVGDIKSDTSANYLTYNPAEGGDVVASSGWFEFKFPSLSQEKADGGAICSGSANLIFYGAI